PEVRGSRRVQGRVAGDRVQVDPTGDIDQVEVAGGGPVALLAAKTACVDRAAGGVDGDLGFGRHLDLQLDGLVAAAEEQAEDLPLADRQGPVDGLEDHAVREPPAGRRANRHAIAVAADDPQ